MDLSARKTLVFVVFLCRVFFCVAVQVSTPKGKIVGSENLTTRNGRVIYSFTGIPYARPPVGELRFKEAQPAEPWQKPFDATKGGPECIQIDHFLSYGGERPPPVFGQEDCLILNVYSPKVDSDAKLPVMVYVHGGGFMQGSSIQADYGPEYLLDEDVVLVTINYRLGALGFLMSGDDVIPGNVGMKDQILALRWVHDNIKNFGGDPDLVTLFGESAGGASTHLDILSPLSKGLIHRGIAMSGSAFCPWAVTSTKLAIEKTKALAVLSRCPTEPTQEMLTCLQSTPAHELLINGRKFQDFLMTPACVFAPAIEPEGAKNAYLPTHPRELTSDVPLMAGVTSGEGGIFVSALLRIGEPLMTDLKENSRRLLPKVLMLDSDFTKDMVPTVSEKIQKFYFGKSSIDRDSAQKLVDLLTDRWFLHGAIEAVSKYKGDAYLYYYDYEHSNSFNSLFGTGELKGVCHCDDLLDFFPMSRFIPNRSISEQDLKISEKFIELSTNFAKHGKLPEDALFKEEGTGKSNSNKYLDITADGIVVKENLLPERVEFWKSLKSLKSGSEPSHTEL